MGRGQPMHAQMQQGILNLVEYFQQESLHGGSLLPLSQVHKRVAQALKVSERVISRVVRAGEPVARKLTKTRKSIKTDISEEKKSAIKDLITVLYARNEKVTYKTLTAKLSEAGVMNIGLSSLRTVLTGMGYKFEHVPGGTSWILKEGKIRKKRVIKKSANSTIDSKPMDMVITPETECDSKLGIYSEFLSEAEETLKPIKTENYIPEFVGIDTDDEPN